MQDTEPTDKLRLTAVFNYSRLPSISVLNGLGADHLPRGLMISGGPFADALVLRVAHANQQVSQFPLQRPRFVDGGPEYDRLAESLTTTIDRSERTRILVDMARIYAEELPAIPLFFRAQPWVFVDELKGPRLVPSESNMAWDVHQWEFK